MSSITQAPTPEQDAFATRAVINILRRESAVFEDNLRRNRDLASGHLLQRVVNRIHATINGLETQLGDERTEAAA